MISAFVASYGYAAVLVGALLEGEAIMIAAGFAAQRRLLDLPVVIVVGMLGGSLSDQLMFLIGRWKGNAIIERVPTLARHKPRVHDLLERHATVFILVVRFLYGLRIAGPVLLGSSRVSLLRFAILNGVGAALWAGTLAGAGYAFGAAINAMIDDIRRIEEWLLVGIIAAGGCLWLWHRARSRHTRGGVDIESGRRS